MKLTRKSLSKWLWFIQQTAKVEELQYPLPEHEPLSFRNRDEKVREVKRRAK